MFALVLVVGRLGDIVERFGQPSVIGQLLMGMILSAILMSMFYIGGELAQSRLQVLKTQLQPHFLFNTLNTAIALVRVDRSVRAAAGRYAGERRGHAHRLGPAARVPPQPTDPRRRGK